MKWKYILVILLLLLSATNVYGITDTVTGSWSCGYNWYMYQSFFDSGSYSGDVLLAYNIDMYGAAPYYLCPKLEVCINGGDCVHLSGSCHGTTSRTGSLNSYCSTSGSKVTHHHIPTGGSGNEVTYNYNYYITYDETLYTVSGVTCGIDTVDIYLVHGGSDIYMESATVSTTNSYSFDIADNTNYKLVFNDGHEYEFVCSGDVNYDRDICTYSTFNIKDNCENPIINSYGFYTSDDGTEMSYIFDGSSFDVKNIGQTYIDIWVSSFNGLLCYHIDNPLPNTEITYSLVNPTIQWINTIWVYDAIETHLLNDALVTLSQDCIIDTSMYPVRNQYSDASGYACFSQCSLEGASLNVSLSGYQPFVGYIGIGSMDAFQQEKLTMINLYPYDDESNTSNYEYTDWTTSIWFKNNKSEITSEIYDTDEYVDLYYHNNNSYDAPMTLNFEMGLAGTFNSHIPILSWLILSEESGYKRIYNDNFSNHLNYYKATLAEEEIEGWDRTKYLSVINHTDEVIYHYENLTTNIWFAGAINNRIEYKENISITSYANSNNSTLLNVSLELYNETNMIEYINLTWGDFSHPSDRWYYRWSPVSKYEKNKNYTVKMFGFNYQFLKEDMVFTTDLHKNKLTIRVVDDQGDYLNNSYVILEGYGSLSTGSTFYNSYHNLDNGMYQYKATKKGYVSAGWESINLSDVNEIVNYTLTSESSSSINLPLHFSDSDIQGFFYPLMFFLLICLLLGGLKYVAK